MVEKAQRWDAVLRGFLFLKGTIDAEDIGILSRTLWIILYRL